MSFGIDKSHLEGTYEKKIYGPNGNPLCLNKWVKESVAYIVSDPIPKVTLKEHLE